ncbi:hypothetical protein HDU97_002527 [Phlyctochytrium planicorne]|nr:hypothetical protein HDU97_002527 [Phlyctochytrium planicorne]
MWCSSATKLQEEGRESILKGDLENAYILMMRSIRLVALLYETELFSSITVELLPRHPDFAVNDALYRDVKSRASQTMSDLESLKKKIDLKYQEWLNAQQQAQLKTQPAKSEPAPAPKPAEFPKTSGSTAPLSRNGSERVVDRSASPHSLVSSSPFLKDQAFLAKAELPKQPTTPPPSVGNVSRAPSFNDPILKPTPVNLTNLPVARPQYIEETKTIDLAKTVAAVQPPQHLHRQIEEKSMTAAELYTGLQQTLLNGMKTAVLLLDVRPKEDFIQGHIKWKNTLTPGSRSGLVNLEPEWITDG